MELLYSLEIFEIFHYLFLFSKTVSKTGEFISTREIKQKLIPPNVNRIT